MKRFLALLFIAAALAVGWYVVSPWLAMQGIVDAAGDGDTAALEERIDFARLREGANRQVRAEIAERTADGDALERIGGAIAGALAGGAVNAALTPRGIANIVTAGSFAMPLVPERYRGQELEWDVERDGFDRFEGVSTWEDGTEGPVLQFERDGLGWDLVGVQLADWQ